MRFRCGVGRQRRLAGAGQAEEERRVARLADVGRAVHREHALLGQVVVHHREHRLLQLAGVARAADEDHALGEVEHDEGARARAVLCRVGAEFRRVQHREVRIEGRQLRRLGADEHVPHERHVPRARTDVAHREAVLGIGAAVEILDEQLVLHIQILAHVLEERVELRLGERLIDLAPVDVLLGRGVLHHELVVGRAAGVRRGDGDERAHVGELALVTANRGLDQHGRDEIPVDLARRLQSLRGQLRAMQSGVVLRLRLSRHEKSRDRVTRWLRPTWARLTRN